MNLSSLLLLSILIKKSAEQGEKVKKNYHFESVRRAENSPEIESHAKWKVWILSYLFAQEKVLITAKLSSKLQTFFPKCDILEILWGD